MLRANLVENPPCKLMRRETIIQGKREATEDKERAGEALD